MYNDIIDIFEDIHSNKMTVTVFEDDQYVYLDIDTASGVFGDSIAFDADTFLKFADTVAAIAKTIRENG